MELNYSIIGFVLLAVIFLVIYIIKRNNKDLREFKSEIIESELKPDKHEDNKT
jgi:hypothetical protein